MTLGDDRPEAAAGTWVYTEKSLRHSIQPKTPVVMVLVKEPRP